MASHSKLYRVLFYTVTDHFRFWRHRFVGGNGPEQTSWEIGETKSSWVGSTKKRSRMSRVHSMGIDVGGRTIRSRCWSPKTRTGYNAHYLQRVFQKVQLIVVWNWRMFFRFTVFLVPMLCYFARQRRVVFEGSAAAPVQTYMWYCCAW